MNRRRRFSATVLACATLAALSCSDPVAPTVAASVESPPAALLDDLLRGTGLLSCTPLPAQSVTQVVGPGGGTIHVGPHRLIVPEGALESDVAITASIVSEPVNRVQFQPDGLQFSVPARLKMSYANCNAISWLLPKRIAHVSSVLEILEYLLTLDNPFTQTVTARLDHFSDYAVAW